MKLDISSALRIPGTEFPFEHREELPDQVIMGEVVRFPSPAVISGTFLMAEDALVISGNLRAVAHAACARCLSPVTYQVDVLFQETFRSEEHRVPQEEDPWEQPLTFNGNSVELYQMVFTLTLLELPMRFLCDASCNRLPQGVPVESPFYNEETSADASSFSTLKQLFTKDQEE